MVLWLVVQLLLEHDSQEELVQTPDRLFVFLALDPFVFPLFSYSLQVTGFLSVCPSQWPSPSEQPE